MMALHTIIAGVLCWFNIEINGRTLILFDGLSFVIFSIVLEKITITEHSLDYYARKLWKTNI